MNGSASPLGFPTLPLLDGAAAERFWSEHWLRLPFAMADTAKIARPFGEQAFAQRLVTAAGDRVLLSKAGQFCDSSMPPAELISAAMQDGWTICVRRAQDLDAGLAELTRPFASELLAAVDLQYFVTPSETPGFGWHYDAEDVFILQASGVKDYELRKNTVHPWPTRESMPRDQRYEAELTPLTRCRLSAGDWLYIPHGYWHRTHAVSQSISLALGLMLPSAVDLLEFLLRELPGAVEWRQRLSAFDAESLRYACTMLAGDLRRRFADPELVERFWAERRREHGAGGDHSHP